MSVDEVSQRFEMGIRSLFNSLLVTSWTNKTGCFISHKFNAFIRCGVLMVHICCVLANSRVSNNLLLYLIFNL